MKFLLTLLTCLSFFLALKNTALASESTSYWLQRQRFTEGYKTYQSANLKKYDNVQKINWRVKKMRNFLTKYNSPLVPYVEYIIAQADENQIPWSLVTAISGVESSFCRTIPINSYNCWGWKNGRHIFKNYPTAIKTVSEKLKLIYLNRGLVTPEKIGPVYAPPTPNWAAKVRYFMDQIENGFHYSPSQLQIFI